MAGPAAYLAKNKSLVAKAQKAVEAAFPIESKDQKTRVEATNVRIPWDGELEGLNDQQQARQNGKTLAVPILADIQLFRDGKSVQNLKNFKLGELPLLTQLGTFMVNGGDYFTPNQLRLKPGAYTRVMNNGQLETFINLKGRSVRLWMEPEKGVLKLGYGSSNVDFVPIMQAIGVRTPDLIETFGGGKRGMEMLEKNSTRSPETHVDKFLRAVMERKQNRDLVRAGLTSYDSPVDKMSYAERVGELQSWFGRQKTDPFVMRKTVGSPFETLSADALLAAAKKLIAVSRHDAPPDDRDSPEFKTLHSADDMLPERITSTMRLLSRKLLNRLNRPDSTIARGFGKNWINVATMGYFGESQEVEAGLAHTADAANPLAILGEHSKTTLMGEGGIGEDRAVTMNARLFRPIASTFIDPVHSPEGSAVGVTTHLAVNASKNATNHLTTKMYKVEKGRIGPEVTMTIEDVSDAIVGYPEYWDLKPGGKPKEKMVRANRDGDIVTIPAEDVEYVMLSGIAMLDHTSNAAAFFHHTHATRGMMAGKHLSQALPLVDREHPLSDTLDSAGKSIRESLAIPFVVRSSVAGTVTKVTKTGIKVGDTNHEILDDYPMQAKVGIDHIPVVKVGDVVKKGQLLADTNYTRDGKLTLGVNVRTAYTPWKNAGNFEDAIVISESAAKKFTSMHIHRLDLSLDTKGLTVGFKMAQSQFPTMFTQDNAKKLDDDGIIKVGSTVNPNEVVIAAVKKREYDAHDRGSKNMAEIHKSLERPYLNASVTWDEDFPGTAAKVVRTGSMITVHMKTLEPARVGDKLSMGSAAKGTISQIYADDKMPRDGKNQHIEVLLNPHGVAGRINPSQTIEQAAGKLVRDYGETYDHRLFDGVDHPVELKKLLAKKGATHAEKLFDPETGKWTEEPVATGYNYMFKLDHPVRKKFSARERDGYTMDETPTAGRGKGGQSYDQLTTYALLGHNAHATLGESFGIRGVKNDDYWHAYQAGETPPPPKAPFVFEKFRAMLSAAGVDTKQHGNTLNYLPMTEARIKAMSNGEITEASALRARGTKSLDVVEEKGGLFDVGITGGLKGDNWAHITLPERVPHPLYEKVIRDLTGLKTSEYYGLLAHSLKLDPRTGKVGEDGTLTGEKAFKHLLSFDLNDKAKELKDKLKTAVGSDANRYNRAHRYVMGLKATDLTPEEAYMTKVIPVIPPKYRPVTEMRGGALRVADANLMYRDVLMATNQLKSSKDSGVPDETLRDSRLNLYKSVGALVGVNNALTHRDDREDAKGLIDTIKGRINKEGLFQRMLARRRNDYTGRSTIEPDAGLGVDEIGLPDDMAWKIYKPIVIRRMVLGGWKPHEASAEVEKRSMAASQALDAEMAERPVLYNRAPSLHRWAVGAAIPSRHAGKDIKISPSIIGPTNADFDGDHQIGVVFCLHPVGSQVGGSPMAARFHSTLPAFTGDNVVSIVDLADFPHGAVRGITDGKNGRIAFFDAAPGLKVLAYDAAKAEMVWADVDGWSEHYDREIEIVELSSGHQVITDDDPRAVYGLDVDTLVESRATPTNAVGRILVPRTVRGIPSFSAMSHIDVPAQLQVHARGNEPWSLPSRLKLTENLGYLIGVFVGDGWASGRTAADGDRKVCQVSVAGDVDDGVMTAFHRAVHELLPGIPATEHRFIRTGSRHGTCERVTYCSVELASLLEMWCGHGAKNKHLPPWYLAAPEAFRRGLFGGLMDTDGSISVSQAKRKPQAMAGFTSISLRLVREARLLAASLDIRGRISGFKYKGQAAESLRDKQAWQLALSTPDVVAWGGKGMKCARKTDKLAGIVCNVEHGRANDCVPFPAALHTAFATVVNRADNSAGVMLYRRNPTISRTLANRVIAIVGADAIAKTKLGRQWLAIVADTSVAWDTVQSVEKTGIRETGYDLTVPGYETFMNIDGVVLSNTVSITVPITDAAKREAHGMLPSKNLTYDKDRSLAYGLEKDIISGLFVLTKTGIDSGKTFESADAAIAAYRDPKNNLRMDSLVRIKGETGKPAIGWLMFMQLVPARFRTGITAPIDGKKLEAVMKSIADTSPGDFNMMSRVITQAGFAAAAAKGGITSSIDELAMDRTKVNRLIDLMVKDVASVRSRNLSVPEQNKALVAVQNKYTPDINQEVLGHLDDVGHGYSTMMKARTSGKVNPDQFRQMLASPLLMTDVDDNVVPAVITSNYGGGMTPSDYVMTTPGARKGIVARSLATAQPGFLAKVIAGNMAPIRINTVDCQTTRGIEMPLSDATLKNYDSDILDRHLLKDISGTTFRRNDPVTPAMLSRLRDLKKESVWVRSPMTCQANPGPCQMCAGRDASGALHAVGSNIGIGYGQTVSERSVQLIMRAFHSGGTLGSGDSLKQGFTRLHELLSAPDIVRDQGTLSDVDGRVHNIRSAPQGGSYVTLLSNTGSPKEHYVAEGRKILVKVGDEVKDGEPLSDGSYRPQDIAQKNGLLAAQTYVVDQARKAYQDAGVTVRKPVIEVLAAGIMRYVKVTDDGDQDGVAIGDIIPEQQFEQMKKTNPKLRAMPEIPGLSSKPLLSGDLMERLNFQRLEDAVREVPAMAGHSDLTGSTGSPLAGFAYGANFRPGEASFELGVKNVGK